MNRLGRVAVLMPSPNPMFDHDDFMTLRELLNGVLGQEKVIYSEAEYGTVGSVFESRAEDIDSAIFLLPGDIGYEYLSSVTAAQVFGNKTKILFSLTPVLGDTRGKAFTVFRYHKYRKHFLRLKKKIERFLFRAEFD